MMRNDAFDRLRRVNPFPANATAPAVGGVLERLDDDHSELLRASPEDRPPAERRPSAPLMTTLRAAPVVFAIVVAAVIGVGALVLLGRAGTPRAGHPSPLPSASSGLPPVPSLGPGNRQALNYVSRARLNFDRSHRACFALFPLYRPSTPDYGSPSKTLLSRFGVLTLPSSARGANPSLGLIGRVFVKYVRIAQRRFGLTFEVFPVVMAARGLSFRCVGLEAAAIHTALAHAPADIRARATRVADEQRRDQEYIARHPEGLCVSGGGGFGCDAFLYVQARGAIQRGGSGNAGSLFEYLVPNGVASITARYPAEGPATGFAHKLPSATVTARVINNLAVWRMAREPGDVFPTIVWHAADGRTMRTVPSA